MSSNTQYAELAVAATKTKAFYAFSVLCTSLAAGVSEVHAANSDASEAKLPCHRGTTCTPKAQTTAGTLCSSSPVAEITADLLLTPANLSSWWYISAIALH